MSAFRCVLKPTGHPTFRIPPAHFPLLLRSLRLHSLSRDAYTFLKEERQRLYQQVEIKEPVRLTPLNEASFMIERMSIQHKLSILDKKRSPLLFRPWLFDMDRSELHPERMYEIMDQAIKISAKTWLQICRAEGHKLEFENQLTKLKERGLLYGQINRLQDSMVKELSQKQDHSSVKLREAILSNSIFGFRPQLRFSKEGVLGQSQSEQAKLEKALHQVTVLRNLGCWFGGVVLANCNHTVYIKFIQKLNSLNLLKQLAVIPLIQDQNDLVSLCHIANDHVKHSQGPFTAMMAKSDSAVNNGINRFSMSFEFAKSLRQIKKTHGIDVSIDFGTGSSGPRFGPIQFHSTESTVNYFGKLIHLSGAVQFCRTLQGQQFIFHDGNLVQQINKDINQKVSKLREQDKEGQICATKYQKFLASKEWTQFSSESQRKRKEIVKKGSKFHLALSNIVNKQQGVNTLTNYGSRGQLHPEIEKFPNLRAIQLVQIYSQVGIFPELMTALAEVSAEHKAFLISQYKEGNAIVQTLLENYWFIKEKFNYNFLVNKKLLNLCPHFPHFYAQNEQALANLHELVHHTLDRKSTSIMRNKHILLRLQNERVRKVPHYRFSTSKLKADDKS